MKLDVKHELSPVCDTGARRPSLLCTFVLLWLITGAPQLSAQLRWEEFANLEQGRHWHAVQYLAGDRIIVMGGYVNSVSILGGAPTRETEIIDLKTRAVTPGPPMRHARAEFPTVVLPDGDVLVIGGYSSDGGGAVIERLDVQTMTWTMAGTLQSSRRQHAADFLSSDEVLIFAGFGNATAEIYDISTGRSRSVRSLPSNANNAVSVNPDGRGPSYFGFREGGPNSPRSRRSLRYYPSTDLWENDLEFDETPVAPRVTALNDGSVVVAGGALSEAPFIGSTSTWVVDPRGVVRKGPSLNVGRQHIGMGTWRKGRVLTAGGIANGVVFSDACEWIDLDRGVVERGPDLIHERCYSPMVMAPAADGRMRAFMISGLRNGSNTPLIEVLQDSACQERVISQPLTAMRLVGSAISREGGIRLTSTDQYLSGGAYVDRRISVRDGFDITFSFRLSDGNDNGMVDNGDPGADGIAVVFLRDNPTALGRPGDGIGYHEITHGMAVEYDSYLNPAFSDPSTSHVAVQVGDGRLLRAWHQAPYLRGIATEGVPSFKADGTIYHGRIRYVAGSLSVFVSTTGEFTIPVIKIDTFDIQSALNLDSRGSCYVGFTSSTGMSSEVHELLSVEISDCDPLISSIGGDQTRFDLQDAAVMIAPNPTASSCSLRFGSAPTADGVLEVIDQQGRIVHRRSIHHGTQQVELFQGEVLAVGTYMVRIVCAMQVHSLPLVIIR